LRDRGLGGELGHSSLTPISRRIFSDGRGVVRAEVGFTLRSPKKRSRLWLSGEGCTQLVFRTLDVPTRVPSPDGSHVSQTLLRSDRPIAKYLLHCTTLMKRNRDFELKPWWLSPGQPSLVLEYPAGALRSLPRQAQQVQAVSSRDATLHHMALWRHGHLTTIWLIGVKPSANRDVIRRLRIHLTRLHTERECLSVILSNIALGKIPVKRGTDETERLQSYLNKAMKVFFAAQRYGIDQSDILRVAYQYDDLVSAGERPALEEQLSEIRGNISRKVKEGIVPKQQSDDPRFVMMVGKIDKAVFGTEVTDVENYVNIGGSVTGNVIVDATIKDSFKRFLNLMQARSLRITSFSLPLQ
jgi:hypothetical protein